MFATNKSVEIPVEIIGHLNRNFSNRKLWAVLAFQAGWINGGGFLAVHRFVTHTTGFATQFGYDLAFAKWSDALAMITVPLFFMAGAMIGAFYVDRPQHQNQQAKFHVLFFLMSVFLGAVTVFGTMGAFGTFGQELDIMTAYSLIALLCLSSGIQNACSTTASKNYVRTTHLTGYTTDLGISIVRLFSMKDPQKLLIEKNQNQIRILVVATFILGTALSSLIFYKYGYLGFAVPTAISAVLYFAAKKAYKHNA